MPLPLPTISSTSFTALPASMSIHSFSRNESSLAHGPQWLEIRHIYHLYVISTSPSVYTSVPRNLSTPSSHANASSAMDSLNTAPPSIAISSSLIPIRRITTLRMFSQSLMSSPLSPPDSHPRPRHLKLTSCSPLRASSHRTQVPHVHSQPPVRTPQHQHAYTCSIVGFVRGTYFRLALDIYVSSGSVHTPRLYNPRIRSLCSRRY
jgi:hypothetical protein